MLKRLVPAIVLLFSTPCAGSDVTTIVAARDAVARGDWQAAVDPLTALVVQSPLNGEFRIDLARAHYYTGKQAEAEADYRAAFELKAVDPAIAAYGVAKCNALLGRREAMLKWLGIATSLGLRRLEGARSDEDFKSYQNDPDFRRLVGLAGAVSRDDGWRGDIAMLADWIKKKSFHPFRTSTGDRIVSGATLSEAAFDGTVAELTAGVPKLSDAEIEIALFHLVAALGDGHTAIEGSRSRPEFALTLPLGFYVFDDGLYVISAAPAYADLVGARVVALDGTKAGDALARLDPLISRDNAQWVKAMEPRFLRHTPFLKALGIAKADDAVDLSVVLRDGTQRTISVKADTTAPDIWNALPKPDGWVWIGDTSASLFQQGNDKAYWWKWIAADGVLYAQYNKVADTKKQTLAGFAQELAGAIARYPVRKLVIDMRNNNGGDTYLNEALLAAIAGNPKIDRTGHLYVIIGRRTFSAAMNAVSYFARFTKAVFVGEPTGGKPNAPGDETPFTLPYSGIVVNLSDRYWQGGWPDDFADFRAPDIAVASTFADVATGRDAAMEIVAAQPDISR
jgi:Bacterial transcriptional activator domain